MPTHDESTRDRLLSNLPEPANLQRYRDAVTSMLEKQDQAFHREKWQTRAVWVFVVLLSTLFLYLGSVRIETPKGAWFGSLACFWFLFGTVYLMKNFITELRVNLLKEVKQLQVQVLELHALVLKNDSQRPGA